MMERQIELIRQLPQQQKYVSVLVHHSTDTTLVMDIIHLFPLHLLMLLVNNLFIN